MRKAQERGGCTAKKDNEEDGDKVAKARLACLSKTQVLDEFDEFVVWWFHSPWQCIQSTQWDQVPHFVQLELSLQQKL